MARTPLFHGGNAGSIPAADTFEISERRSAARCSRVKASSGRCVPLGRSARSQEVHSPSLIGKAPSYEGAGCWFESSGLYQDTGSSVR